MNHLYVINLNPKYVLTLHICVGAKHCQKKEVPARIPGSKNAIKSLSSALIRSIRFFPSHSINSKPKYIIFIAFFFSAGSIFHRPESQTWGRKCTAMRDMSVFCCATLSHANVNAKLRQRSARFYIWNKHWQIYAERIIPE